MSNQEESKSELKESTGSCCCSVPLTHQSCCPGPILRQVGNYKKALSSRIKKRKSPAKKTYSYSKRKTK
jgi:hypothetical protein